jgi:hypothetical protein
MSVLSATEEAEASIGQRLLWLLDHYRGGASLSVPIGWRIRGAIDLNGLQTAIDGLVRRHETLRTTYAQRGRRLVQVIHPPRPVPLSERDLRADPGSLKRALADEVATAVDPTEWPLRVTLWRVGEQEYVLLFVVHHLATDFFSNMILERDLGLLYESVTGAGEASLPPVEWSYADWGRWQQETFAAGRQARLKRFWEAELDGAELIAPPVGPALEPAGDGEGPAPVTLDLDPDTVAGLGRLAGELRTTPFAVMLATFYAQLHGLTGRTDLAVSSLFANRMRPEVAETVGFFVNMIVLRTRMDEGDSFRELARATRSTVLRGMAHADLPQQMLPPGTVDRRADGVVFQFLEAPARRSTSLRLQSLDLTLRRGRFDMELIVYNRERLMLRCGPGADGEKAERLLRDYGSRLAWYAEDPGRPAGGRPPPSPA